MMAQNSWIIASFGSLSLLKCYIDQPVGEQLMSVDISYRQGVKPMTSVKFVWKGRYHSSIMCHQTKMSVRLGLKVGIK